MVKVGENVVASSRRVIEPYVTKYRGVLSKALYPFAFVTLLIVATALGDVIVDLFGLRTTSAYGPFVIAAFGSFLAFAVWLWFNRDDALYRGVRAFFQVILNIYFKNLHIINTDVIPDGPVIITGNHQNQFVDGVLQMCSCPRKMHTLMAKKSLDRPVIGHFGSAMGCIPVIRAKDVAKKGAGHITAEGLTVTGHATGFLAAVEVGWQIKVNNVARKVTAVVSDTELTIHERFEDDFDHLREYTILPKVSHGEMYAAVYNELSRGGAIGIFPEGGSHDRSELLPLKAGVAFMALGTLDEYPAVERVAILPSGLTYFQAHRFRSSVFVEFGSPFYVTRDDLALFKENKRAAVGAILAKVEGQLRSVTINCPDKTTLHIIQTIRDLYTPSNMELSNEDRVHLTQRLAIGYKAASARREDFPQFDAMEQKVLAYNALLKKHGLKANHRVERSMYGLKLIPKFIFILGLSLLAAIPGLLLNAPVGLLAKLLARWEQEKALAKSDVKLEAKDVVSSYKILVSLVLMPVWYFTVSVLIAVWGGQSWRDTVLIIFSLPFFSYLGIRFTEQGVITSKSVKPMLLRVLPSYREEQEKISEMRSKLQVIIRTFVEEVGGQLEETKAFMDDRIVKRRDFQEKSDLDEFVYEDDEDDYARFLLSSDDAIAGR